MHRGSKIFLPDLCTHRVNGVDHLYLGSVDDPLGHTASTHPPKGTKTMSLPGRKGSCISYNQVVHESVKRDDVTRVNVVALKTRLNDVYFRNRVLAAAAFKRIADSESGLMSHGFPDDIRKDGGYFYQNVIDFSSKNKLNPKTV